MSSCLRPLFFASIASASMLLVHCGGGDDILQNPEPDAAADGSVDGRAPNDATVPKDATSDTTGDASDATTHDANVTDASDAASKDASDAGASDAASIDASGDDASDGDVADAPVDTGCAATRVLNPIEAGTGPSCPFAIDGGVTTCAFGETCCEWASSSSGPSVCAATCPAPPDSGALGAAWECQDPGSCPTGDVCCANTTGAGQDPGCPNHFLHLFKGTTCRTQCQAGEIQLCETQSQCASVSSTTCQVTAAKGLAFGLCLP